jgi:hypothetical protein
MSVEPSSAAAQGAAAALRTGVTNRTGPAALLQNQRAFWIAVFASYVNLMGFRTASGISVWSQLFEANQMERAD